MPGEHAYFSPSASSRWLECPASLYLYEGLDVKNETSTYAHEGTVCHEIAAICLVKKIPVSKYTGKVIQNVMMTPELIQGIQMYVDEVQGLTKEFDAIGGRIEQKVEISEECWGTVDAVVWNADTLVCIDLKMGKGVVVKAVDNPQLKIYSIGATRYLLKNHNLRPKKIINYIIQPRTPNPIRKAEYTIGELQDFAKNKLAPVLKMKDEGKLSSEECNPGEAQCKWCDIKDCKAKANKAINDAERAFAPFAEFELPEIETTTSGNPTLSIVEMAALKSNFKFITDWIGGIDKLLKDKALSGEKIPGYKLVEGKAHRKWGVQDSKVEDLLRVRNVEPYTKKILSPAQAEKALGKNTAREMELSEYIVKPKGAPTLVVESDKRNYWEPEITGDEAAEELVKVVEVTTPPELTLVVDVDTVSTPTPTRARVLSVKERMAAKMCLAKEIKQEYKCEFTDKEEEQHTPSDHVVEEVKRKEGIRTPPRKGTKRLTVLEMGKARKYTLQDVVNTLECSLNMVKMHLRYLHETNGYGYIIYKDDSFEIV